MKTLWVEVAYTVTTIESKTMFLKLKDLDLDNPKSILEKAQLEADNRKVEFVAEEDLQLQKVEAAAVIQRFYIDKDGKPYLSVPIDRTVLEEFLTGGNGKANQ